MYSCPVPITYLIPQPATLTRNPPMSDVGADDQPLGHWGPAAHLRRPPAAHCHCTATSSPSRSWCSIRHVVLAVLTITSLSRLVPSSSLLYAYQYHIRIPKPCALYPQSFSCEIFFTFTAKPFASPVLFSCKTQPLDRSWSKQAGYLCHRPVVRYAIPSTSSSGSNMQLQVRLPHDFILKHNKKASVFTCRNYSAPTYNYLSLVLP